MYGTDHMEPSRNTSKAIAYADNHLSGTHVIHSTLPRFVAAAQADIKNKNSHSQQSKANCALAGVCTSCRGSFNPHVDQATQPCQ